jgi:hypothetical protein
MLDSPYAGTGAHKINTYRIEIQRNKKNYILRLNPVMLKLPGSLL